MLSRYPFGRLRSSRGRSRLWHPVQSAIAALERRDIRESCLCDVGQGFAREEALMGRHQHVGEGEQAHEHVVLHDLLGEVAKEELLFLLVDVDAEMAELPRLERPDG